MPTVVTQSYRVYFLSAKNRIADAHVLDCADDETAVTAALELLRQHPEYPAVEIWQDSRKVGTYRLPSRAADGPTKADEPSA